MLWSGVVVYYVVLGLFSSSLDLPSSPHAVSTEIGQDCLVTRALTSWWVFSNSLLLTSISKKDLQSLIVAGWLDEEREGKSRKRKEKRKRDKEPKGMEEDNWSRQGKRSLFFPLLLLLLLLLFLPSLPLLLLPLASQVILQWWYRLLQLHLSRPFSLPFLRISSHFAVLARSVISSPLRLWPPQTMHVKWKYRVISQASLACLAS